jgi:hypothetical protein
MSIKKLKTAFRNKIPLPIASIKLLFPTSFRVYVFQWANFTNNDMLPYYGSFYRYVKEKDKVYLVEARKWISNKKLTPLSLPELNRLFQSHEVKAA